MNIVLMVWPWTHMNFVYMQKNDLGRYLVLVFWCRERVLFESKFYCIDTISFLVKCDSQ